MHINLDVATGAAPSLHDPSNFRDFYVLARGGPDEDGLRDRLRDTGIGRIVADGHTWISGGAVRRLADQAGMDAQWNIQFQAMAQYAATKGWYDSATDSIRAHIEWS